MKSAALSGFRDDFLIRDSFSPPVTSRYAAPVQTNSDLVDVLVSGVEKYVNELPVSAFDRETLFDGLRSPSVSMKKLRPPLI